MHQCKGSRKDSLTKKTKKYIPIRENELLVSEVQKKKKQWGSASDFLLEAKVVTESPDCV